MAEEQFTWREILGQIITDAQEKQRIANLLGVNPATLTRWVNNISNPRLINLHHLLEALPQHRTKLLPSIEKEFEHFSQLEEQKISDETQEIPSAFYARVINAYSTLVKAQRFWSISNLILQQALGQLDPNHLGLAITVVQCMPPTKEQKIRSLRERIGRGTPPWQSNLEQQAIFLGAESLAGFVVTTGYRRVIQTHEEAGGIFPAHWVDWEESAAAYPIMRGGAIAGCLLVSSTQPNYFLPLRCNLIENYAELMTLAFEVEDFFDIQHISLSAMPDYREQGKHFQGFHQRVSNLMIQANRSGTSINLIQAQQLVWQQIEQELLQQL